MNIALNHPCLFRDCSGILKSPGNALPLAAPAGRLVVIGEVLGVAQRRMRSIIFNAESLDEANRCAFRKR
jgi:hypothetical protein